MPLNLQKVKKVTRYSPFEFELFLLKEGLLYYITVKDLEDFHDEDNNSFGIVSKEGKVLGIIQLNCLDV